MALDSRGALEVYDRVTKELEEEEAQREKPPLRDSWLLAFIEGNAIIPQSNTGITALPAEAVMRDPPEDWGDFLESNLSDEQLARANQKMNAAHRAAGVPVGTIESQPTRRVLDNDRLRALWYDCPQAVTNSILYYLVNNKKVDVVLLGTPVHTMNELLHNEKYAAVRNELRLILKTMVGVIRGQAVDAVARDFREDYDEIYPVPHNLSSIQETRKGRIAKIIVEETMKALPEIDQEMLKKFLTALTMPGLK